MGYTFDGENSLIVLTPGTTSVTVEDVWSRWVDWYLTDDNSKWLPAMRTVGGDPLSEDKDLGTTFFFINGWRLRPQEANHWLTVDGNLYTDPAGESPFVSTLGSYTVTISMQVSNLSDATLAQAFEVEYSRYDDVVTINVDSGENGTEYPLGTSTNPVNNLDDAKVIAAVWGFKRLKIESDLTLVDGDDVEGYIIESDMWKVVTVEPGANTINTEFRKIDLYGEMSGSWNVLVDCWAQDITNFLGWVRGGSILHVELAPYVNPDPTTLGSSFFDDLLPMFATGNSEIVMNSDTSISLTKCVDIVEVQGMIEGSLGNIGLLGGRLIISDTCVGGEFIVTGIGLVDNQADPALPVNTEGLNNPASVREEIDNASLVRKLLTNKTVEDGSGVTVYDDDDLAIVGFWPWSEIDKTRGKLT